jgi:predicted HTH domain antitoxin
MTLTLDLPSDVDETRARLEVAVALFQREMLTLGRAAHLCGMTYRAFWDELTSRGIPPIVYDEEMVEQDIAFVDSLRDPA